jgi:hypothetical protein
MSNISDIMIRVGELSPIFMHLLRGMSGFTGLYFVGNALYQYYMLSNPLANKTLPSGAMVTPSGATIQMIVGGFLGGFATNNSLQSIVSSLFFTDTFVMPASFSLVGSSSSFFLVQQTLSVAIEHIMALIGSMAIVRALILTRRISLGMSRDPIGHAIYYLVFGAFALNIRQFAEILDNSFGFNFSHFFL